MKLINQWRKSSRKTSGWEDFSWSCESRIDIVKMAILPKTIYMFNTIPIRILMAFFTMNKKSILKFIWKHKRPWIVKATLSKKSYTGGITISDFKLYYKTCTNKNSMLLAHKQTWRAMKLNRRPEINLCSYTHLLVYKRRLKLMVEERQPFQQMVIDNWISTFRGLKLDLSLTLY
jgi:hypothetical protein